MKEEKKRGALEGYDGLGLEPQERDSFASVAIY